MTVGRVAAGLGAIGAALWVLLAATGQFVMPSYLASWLFVMALPLGALNLVMVFELLGSGSAALMPILRRMLLLLPVAALFAIPVMVGVVPLYHRPGMADTLPAWWMEPRFLLVRLVVILVVWTGFALLFSREPRNVARRGVATVGLLLSLGMGSLAALDWVMSLDPGIGSSVFGLLLIVSQLGIALAAAAFFLSVTASGRALAAELPPLTAAALGGWLFLHFTQYRLVSNSVGPTWRACGVDGLCYGCSRLCTPAAIPAIAHALGHGEHHCDGVACASARDVLVGDATVPWRVGPHAG